MNDSFEACSDMWSFACEGWVAKNGLPESRSTWSTLIAMQHKARTEKSQLITMFSPEPSQVQTLASVAEEIKFYLSLLSIFFFNTQHIFMNNSFFSMTL